MAAMKACEELRISAKDNHTLPALKKIGTIHDHGIDLPRRHSAEAEVLPVILRQERTQPFFLPDRFAHAPILGSSVFSSLSRSLRGRVLIEF